MINLMASQTRDGIKNPTMGMVVISTEMAKTRETITNLPSRPTSKMTSCHWKQLQNKSARRKRSSSDRKI